MSAASDPVGLARDAQQTVAWDAEWLTFYVSWRPRLLAFLLSITDDTRFVEDVVEDSFLASRKYWRRIRDYDKPDAYLFKIAKQELRSRQARDARWNRPLGDRVDDSSARSADLVLQG